MNTSQTLRPLEKTIYKIKSNLEKASSIISKKPIKISKRGRQPYSNKLKYFPLEDKEEINSNLNLIPKKNNRNKNLSSHKLFIKNLNNNHPKISNEENDSDSDFSNSYSRDYKMAKYFGECRTNNNYNYPTRKDVGLYSSEEDNSSDNSLIEENFGMEIERILIEIYNKNISNIHNNKKPKNDSSENVKGEDHLKSNFEKYDEKYNLLILKVLSSKIKDLIQKYKEKIYEIPEIKEIYEQQKMIANNKYYKNKSNPIDNDTLIYSNKNKINSKLNEANDSDIIQNNKAFSFLTSKLKYYSFSQKKVISYENLLTNSKMLLQVKDEIIEYGIPKTLLRELKNIKHTLIISSSEIENVFEYPLSLLKDDNNNSIKFSLEKMQLEEFWKILLKDDFISSLITQIKIINSTLKISDITDLLNQVNDNEFYHQNEMTKFEEFINNKLKYDNSSVITCNNNSTSSFLRECNEISAKAFTLTSASSVESIYDRNESNNNIADLDELVKYINEETEIKKSKKNKIKKSKKNMNKISCSCMVQNSKESNENETLPEKNEENKKNGISGNDDENQDVFTITDKNVEDFKKELESFSLPSYKVQKIIPALSEEYIKMLDVKYLDFKEEE